MKRKRLAIIGFYLILAGASVFADYKADYERLLKEGKLEELSALLAAWEREDSRNPEVYIAYFNYYLRTGMHSGISIDAYLKDPRNELALRDPKTNEIAGYINDGTWYEKEACDRGLEYLNRGLALAPDRLDMHFGQIHVLGQIGEYGLGSERLIELLRRSRVNGNKWLWSNGESVTEDGEAMLLDSVNDYYGLWLRVRTADSLKAAEAASAEQVRLYPRSLYGYNIMGVVNGIRGNLGEALGWYLKAEELDGKDYIVLNNIAYCYEQLSEIDNAIGYYRKMEALGNEEVADYARKKLARLGQ